MKLSLTSVAVVTVATLVLSAIPVRAHNGVVHDAGSDVHPVAQTMMKSSEVMRETPMKATGSSEERKAVVDARCAKITANINSRLTNYSDHKDLILGRYERIHERVTALLQKLDENGYDTSTVRANLETLKSLLAKAGADYRAFIAKLELTKQFACGDSDGQFLVTLKDSQEAMKVFQADLKEIKTFVQGTLRPNLKALKDQEPELTEAAPERMRTPAVEAQQ